MKLLLDMYRSAPKEQRDKVQLMAAEKKTKSEVINYPIIFLPQDVQLCSLLIILLLLLFLFVGLGRGVTAKTTGIRGERKKRGKENGR